MRQKSVKLSKTMNVDVKERSKPLLIGNTFPLNLIRRRVLIDLTEVDVLRNMIDRQGFVSFWGHSNTLMAAGNLLGIDLTPTPPRPALKLAGDGRPILGDLVFEQCWVLSPDYVAGFRPAVGQEVPVNMILTWRALRIDWN